MYPVQQRGDRAVNGNWDIVSLSLSLSRLALPLPARAPLQTTLAQQRQQQSATVGVIATAAGGVPLHCPERVAGLRLRECRSSKTPPGLAGWRRILDHNGLGEKWEKKKKKKGSPSLTAPHGFPNTCYHTYVLESTCTFLDLGSRSFFFLFFFFNFPVEFDAAGGLVAGW